MGYNKLQKGSVTFYDGVRSSLSFGVGGQSIFIFMGSTVYHN